MASKTLRNPPRPKDQPILAKPKTKRIDNPKGSLCSLFIVLAVPLSLSLAMIHLFGSGRRYRALAKPFWFPSLTAIHLGSVGSTFLMSLAAWLVWTGGGFGIDSEALPLYLAQISLSMVWDPLVLRIGAAWLGFLLSVLNLGTLFACYRAFGKVNPLSRKFVEPCLTWVAYLTLVTFDLVYL
ncbi:hypothetical protein OIU78_004108 [Salix suchowensis]|nr:hypothetical protein OIU78_004108 [Salix suchowensis]